MGRIRQARRRLGLSQEELAEASGVSAATIVQVELGNRRPQGRTLRKLAGALGVEVSDLFEEESEALPKAPRRSSLEPSLFYGDEEERHTLYLKAYRDELRATAAHARAILEGVDSFSDTTGWDAAPETVLSLWNGEINVRQEDAHYRAVVWGEVLEGLAGQALPEDERALVDEVGRWLESYKDTADQLRARLVAEWESFRQHNPKTTLPDELAVRRARHGRSRADGQGSATG